MKKFLIALAVVSVLATASVFAAKWSFTIAPGYDLSLTKAKLTQNTASSCSAGGFGLHVAGSHSIEKLKNWHAQADMSVYFPGKVTFLGTATETANTKLGLKAHAFMKRYVDFKIPFDIYFGAGLAYGNTLCRVGSVKNSFTTLGIALLAEARWKFADNWALNLTVNPDLNFLTVANRRESTSGYLSITRRTSFQFGFALSAKLGITYSI